MPNFLIYIFISLFLRLLSNDVFLKKFLKIIVTRLIEVCEERDLDFFATICRSFLQWLDTASAGIVLKDVANSKRTQREIKSCVKDNWK